MQGLMHLLDQALVQSQWRESFVPRRQPGGTGTTTKSDSSGGRLPNERHSAQAEPGPGLAPGAGVAGPPLAKTPRLQRKPGHVLVVVGDAPQLVLAD